MKAIWRLPLLLFVAAFLAVLVVVGSWKIVQEEHAMRMLVADAREELREAWDAAEMVLEVLAAAGGERWSTDDDDDASLEPLVRKMLQQHRSQFSAVACYGRKPKEESLEDRERVPGDSSAESVFYSRFVVSEDARLAATLRRTLPRQLLGTVLQNTLKRPVPVLTTNFPKISRPALIWLRAVPSPTFLPSVKRRRIGAVLVAVVDLARLQTSWEQRHFGSRMVLQKRKDERPLGKDEEVKMSWSLDAVRPSLLQFVAQSREIPGLHLEIRRHLGIIQLWPPEIYGVAFWIALFCGMLGWSWQRQQRKAAQAVAGKKVLEREQERALRTLHAIGDMVLVVDADWRLCYANSVARKMLCMSESVVREQKLEEAIQLRDPETGKAVDDLRAFFLKQSVEGGRKPLYLVNRQGRETTIDSRVSPLSLADGHDGWVIVMRDVSAEQALLKQLAYQSSHDALTGLYNRGAFEKWVRGALGGCNGEEGEHAVIYLDLDRFKLINDTCGHVAGDELLKRMAEKLSASLRAEDRLARVGGDEFGILLPCCSLELAEKIAKRILSSIGEYRFHWEEKVFQVSASIGVLPVGRDGIMTLKEVLMAADLACHVAKEEGRNRIHVHVPDDDEISRHHHQMQWLPRLHEALDNDRFDLFVQPIMPLDEKSSLPPMNEFLIRLWTREGKLLPPGLFIPAAERFDLMWQIDRWMVENAIGRLAEAPADQLYTINLSAQTFGDRSFAEFVAMTLESYGVEARRICFELTETAAVSNITVAAELMQALKELGCRILLDDFGSGLSSFGYLKNLPIDYLKIDGQFVKEMLTDPLDEAMVRMCHELAQVLEVRTVAEFIESAELLEAVRAVGIDYGQGYHLGRPRPVDFRRSRGGVAAPGSLR